MLRARSAFVQNGRVDWNDLRHFLAVAETGSTLAAGRALRVSQTTAARRVAALETALGLALFERRPAGHLLTPAGEALLPHARAARDAMARVADAAGTQAREAHGIVRVTASDILATTLLPAMLRDLHDAHPGIRIELVTTDALLDLGSGAADVAIRSCPRPAGAGLVARRLLDDVWTVYCSRGYAAAHGWPTRRRDLPGHGFIGGGEEGVWKVYLAWLRENGLEDAVTLSHNASTGLLAGVRAGAGLAALPCLVADQDAELLRCLPPRTQADRALWLVTHERLRHTPRVRVVLEFVAERLLGLRAATS